MRFLHDVAMTMILGLIGLDDHCDNNDDGLFMIILLIFLSFDDDDCDQVMMGVMMMALCDKIGIFIDTKTETFWRRILFRPRLFILCFLRPSSLGLVSDSDQNRNSVNTGTDKILPNLYAQKA